MSVRPKVKLGDDSEGAPRHGRRRETERTNCIPWRWPEAMIARRQVMKEWRRVAMRILARRAISFRIPCVLSDCMIWQTGEIWASNEQLAFECGGCSEKTIQRDIGTIADLGLLIVLYGWRRDDRGKLIQTRSLRLALPCDLEDTTPANFEADQMDHACPPAKARQMDHACPKGMDTRGPLSVGHSDEQEGGLDHGR